MQAIESDPQERGDLPADVGVIGVDAAGKRHFWSRHHDAVYLVDDDDRVVDVQQLEGRPMAEYRQFVATRRGWRHWFFGDDAATALAKQITVV